MVDWSNLVDIFYLVSQISILNASQWRVTSRIQDTRTLGNAMDFYTYGGMDEGLERGKDSTDVRLCFCTVGACALFLLPRPPHLKFFKKNSSSLLAASSSLAFLLRRLLLSLRLSTTRFLCLGKFRFTCIFFFLTLLTLL